MNRDGFIDETIRAIGECEYRNDPFPLIFIAIDGMTAINAHSQRFDGLRGI